MADFVLQNGHNAAHDTKCSKGVSFQSHSRDVFYDEQSGFSANIYDDRGLVKNQSDISTNKSHINSKDIEDIRDAIVYISKVAKKNSIPLFVVIPPVHENLNRNSYANDILNIAIDFKFNNVNIIDHRKLILKTNPDYFKAFDHPNAKYGNYLYGKILSFMDN